MSVSDGHQRRIQPGSGQERIDSEPAELVRAE